jgi:hypothetical protein
METRDPHCLTDRRSRKWGLRRAAGDDWQTILAGYPWLEREDIQACLAYALRHIANERIEPLTIEVG